LQHDPSRSVRASLRFTDAGTEESFVWNSGDLADITAELETMVSLLTD